MLCLHFTHEKKKDFNYNLWEWTFRENNGLKKHVSSVHEGIKSLICSICNRRFDRSHALIETEYSVCSWRKKAVQYTKILHMWKVLKQILYVLEKKMPFKCSAYKIPCVSSCGDYWQKFPRNSCIVLTIKVSADHWEGKRRFVKPQVDIAKIVMWN